MKFVVYRGESVYLYLSRHHLVKVGNDEAKLEAPELLHEGRVCDESVCFGMLVCLCPMPKSVQVFHNSKASLTASQSRPPKSWSKQSSSFALQLSERPIQPASTGRPHLRRRRQHLSRCITRIHTLLLRFTPSQPCHPQQSRSQPASIGGKRESEAKSVKLRQRRDRRQQVGQEREL